MDDDYGPPPPSEREQAAHTLARLLAEAGLRTPEQGRTAERSADGRSWLVVYGREKPKARGSVLIYSPAWIRVAWKTDAPGLPANGSRVYSSAEEAAAFVLTAFADLDAAAAMAVPVKEP